MNKKTKVTITLLAAISLLSSFLVVYAQSFQYILGIDCYAPADNPMPEKGLPFTEPDFHTTIVGVTDKKEQ